MNKIELKDLPGFLKAQRIKNGLTIVECSKRLGSRNGLPSAWHRYETGKITPKLSQIEKLFRVVNCYDVVISFNHGKS